MRKVFLNCAKSKIKWENIFQDGENLNYFMLFLFLQKNTLFIKTLKSFNKNPLKSKNAMSILLKDDLTGA